MENNEHKYHELFKSPRINARTAKTICEGKAEDIEFECTVESLLDSVFYGINARINEVLSQNRDFHGVSKEVVMAVDVTINDLKDRNVFDEVCYRLEDYGYVVQMIVEDEDDSFVEYLNEMTELAQEDEVIAKALDDLRRNVSEFRVSWHTIPQDEEDLPEL